MKGLSIPRPLLASPELGTYDRAHRLLWCVREAAEEDGLYRAGDTVARLGRGEFIATHASLADAWGVSRDHARKMLDSLRKIGALDWSDGAGARVAGFPAPEGTRFRLPWIE